MTFRKLGTYSLKVLQWKMLILEIHVLKFLSVTNFSNTFIVVRASQCNIFEILWSVILQLAFLKLWAKSSSLGKLGWQIVKGMKDNKGALNFVRYLPWKKNTKINRYIGKIGKCYKTRKTSANFLITLTEKFMCQMIGLSDTNLHNTLQLSVHICFVVVR